MSEEETACDRCENGTHLEDDLIFVDDKPFCPVTRRRVYWPEEQEEMSEEELQKSWDERIVLVKRGTPAAYKIVEDKR